MSPSNGLEPLVETITYVVTVAHMNVEVMLTGFTTVAAQCRADYVLHDSLWVGRLLDVQYDLR